MTNNRSVAMFALPLALALASSTAHAKGAKEKATPTGKPAQIKVDSPTMATSISDWHTELGGAKGKTSPSKTTQTATAVRQTAPATAQSTQRSTQVSASGKPAERARGVPLTSVKR
jgi:hypothetical protein